MKQHTITLLLGWLLLLSANLIAQNKEGRFKLKEGDWFEVAVEQTKGDHETENYLLRYQLTKQLQNWNQQYLVTLAHQKAIYSENMGYTGYDSYYPAFEENKITPEVKNQYNVEVSPEGKLIRFEPFINNNNSKLNLTAIKPSDGKNVSFVYFIDRNDSLWVSWLTIALIQPYPSQAIVSNQANKVPLIINQLEQQLRVTNASFPLPANAIIKGKLKDQLNQAITINLNGENAASYFPEQQFKTKEDGSFECPIFLKSPLHLKIKIGDRRLTTFMQPGDTLNINRIGYQAREIQNNQYAETRPNKYFSADKSEYFSGNAAYNTMLSNELDQYRDGFNNEKTIEDVIAKYKEISTDVEQLINSYKGKASNQCITYFQLDFQYYLAVAKLYYKQNAESPYINEKGTLTFRDRINYPDNFFSEVDTLPILMKPFEWSTNYQKFILESQRYKQTRLGWAVRKTATNNFMENYYFNLASLKGYPLYLQLAYYIDLEFRMGSDMKKVEPYYFNFINNCADPSLTEPLKSVYEKVKSLQVGNTFPLDAFILQDSSSFNLKRFKGKPICLLLYDGSKSVINQFKEEIEKFKPEEVEFLFVQIANRNYLDNQLDSIVANKTNLSFIEVPEKFLKSELLLDRIKVFTLDKWFRIVENNAEDPITHKHKGSISGFEKAIRKAIEAKRYSKAEESAIIKTAGWSLGSILFTLLVGFGIYRIRIRQIKQQEEAKRRIKELEIKAIRSQMNPHFIFNALNSIQSLINGNQFKEANIYLSKFAVLLRGVLNNSEKGMVSLSDELKAVELYCQLEQLRFDFNFNITIAEDVNGDLIEIPGMIIQPLAENAVVHGISAKGDQGKLGIQVIRQKEHICIEVSDNGVGLSPRENDSLRQKGFGLKLVEERINILNLEGKEARLTVRNIGNSSGTLATLIIPID